MKHEIAFEMAPSPVRFGAGVTREVGMDLADLGVRRVLVLTDPALSPLPPVQAVLQSLVGLTLPAAYKALPNGDANCSGALQALDAQVILARLVGRNVAAFYVGTIQ